MTQDATVDIAVDNPTNPEVMRVHIKQSTTILCRVYRPALFCVWRTSSDLPGIGESDRSHLGT